MKRFLILLTVLTLALTACTGPTRQDDVLSTLGQYEFRHFYTSGGFQDYTDFALYTYAAANLEHNPYFAPLTPADSETLSAFIDDFEDWIDTIRRSDPDNEVAVHYAFDRKRLDPEDWFYLYEDPIYPKFGCYDLWFYDSQSNVLYYFHNNI